MREGQPLPSTVVHTNMEIKNPVSVLRDVISAVAEFMVRQRRAVRIVSVIISVRERIHQQQLNTRAIRVLFHDVELKTASSERTTCKRNSNVPLPAKQWR
jgi:hypothetical protein